MFCNNNDCIFVQQLREIKMATRNRRGRNLITSQTVLGRAKIAALQNAETAGIKNKVLDYITQAGSIQQVLSVLKRFNLE
jgi:hypothetical protein